MYRCASIKNGVGLNLKYAFRMMGIPRMRASQSFPKSSYGATRATSRCSARLTAKRFHIQKRVAVLRSSPDEIHKKWKAPPRMQTRSTSRRTPAWMIVPLYIFTGNGEPFRDTSNFFALKMSSTGATK
jgi:hypothetical protein